MLILSRSDIRRALSMPAAIATVRQAFIDLSGNRAIVPLRTVVPQQQHSGVTLVMPGYLPASDSLAVKIVSVHQENRQRSLPLIHALVLVLDPVSGQPVAALEGGYLTALRTGAASGVATDLLARENAETLAVIGAGAQARTQIQAVVAVRPISLVMLYDRHPERVQALIDELQPQLPGSIEFSGAGSAGEAVQKADVICTATTSRQPVFDGADLRPGTHINAIGSYHPDMREVDGLTLQRAARIIVDAREGALAEAGDLLQAFDEGAITMSDITAEIGEIAAGSAPGREGDAEITYFKSVGNAVQDASVAHAVYQQAVALGLGVSVDLLS